MKVVLAGNPNAGKTTLFNALTGSRLRTGNFHGVTTSAFYKTVDGVTFVDVPGAYSAATYSMEEKAAIEEIRSCDLVINVVDSLTLKNSLGFTRWLLSLGVRVVVYLTKTRRLQKRGGCVDCEKLSQYLGVPVYDCTAKELKEIIFGKVSKRCPCRAYEGKNPHPLVLAPLKMGQASNSCCPPFQGGKWRHSRRKGVPPHEPSRLGSVSIHSRRCHRRKRRRRMRENAANPHQSLSSESASFPRGKPKSGAPLAQNNSPHEPSPHRGKVSPPKKAATDEGKCGEPSSTASGSPSPKVALAYKVEASRSAPKAHNYHLAILPSREGLTAAYNPGNAGLTGFERVILNKYFAVGFFVFFVVAMFFVAFYPTMPGAVLKNLCERAICDKLGGWLAGNITNAALASFVCEGLIGGAGGVISFIPQLAILYLFLTLLDESGVTSALSFVTDGVFEKVNLSGRAAFSLISGFGCTAAAIATTRGFTSLKSQKRTVAALPLVPCGAKLPVFLTFLSPLFKNPFPAVCALYFIGLGLAVACCKLSGRGGEEMLSEVAPVAIPEGKTVAIKLFFYLKGFIIKVATAVTAFCAVSWVLSHFSFSLDYCEVEGSMLCAISRAITPLFYPMGISDWRIAYAALTGFVAKENVAATVGMLMPEGLALSLAPTLGFCAFMLACPACVSAFAASVRECGIKFTLKCFAVQLLAAFAAGYVTYFVFRIFV